MNQAVPFDVRFGLGLRLTEMLCRNVNTIVSIYMVIIPELMHKCFFFLLTFIHIKDSINKTRSWKVFCLSWMCLQADLTFVSQERAKPCLNLFACTPPPHLPNIITITPLRYSLITHIHTHTRLNEKMSAHQWWLVYLLCSHSNNTIAADMEDVCCKICQFLSFLNTEFYWHYTALWLW